MTRRDSIESSESPTPRRTSARIAATQQNRTSLSQLHPKKEKIRKRKSDISKSDNISIVEPSEVNGMKSTNDEQSIYASSTHFADSVESTSKKLRIQPEQFEFTNDQDYSKTDSEKNVLVQDETSYNVEESFEIIDGSSVPLLDSEEVRAAISAQGEDGQLLVNFVQISKDDIVEEDPIATVQDNADVEEKHSEIISSVVESREYNTINGIESSDNAGDELLHNADVVDTSCSLNAIEHVDCRDLEAIN